MLICLGMVVGLACGCGGKSGDGSSAGGLEASDQDRAGSRTIRIIATSDLHGKFMPWDYALNEEELSGSVAQLAKAIKDYRTDDTILVDAGDTLQGNYAQIFIDDEGVHPMIQAINALGYDVWVTGNHDYDYGLDVLKKTIGDLDCTTLTGNVRDKEGDPVAKGYTIMERDGVRIALIGMVTPNIDRWDVTALKGCRVTDPLEETRKIIDRIQGQYDVLVGVFHMGIDNELGRDNSGVTDILNACPEFDVMVSSHEHNRIEGDRINDVLVVQNSDMAKTMSVIDLTLTKEGDGWKVADESSRSVDVSGYEPDEDVTGLLAGYDEQAKAYVSEDIGKLEGGQLAPENSDSEIPESLLQDSALTDFLNDVQMHYAGTEVSATQVFTMETNIYPGDIHRNDTSKIYKMSNTLYKVHMDGSMLRAWMEWSVSHFETMKEGQKSPVMKEGTRLYDFYVFDGVNYEIDLSRPAGSRITDLTWPDGSPVKDKDSFDVAVNNYCARSHLLSAGRVFSEGEPLPTLVEMDVCGDIGGIRELIGDYIVNVKSGRIKAACNHNWRIRPYK